jgi:hypothetical protein
MKKKLEQIARNMLKKLRLTHKKAQNSWEAFMSADGQRSMGLSYKLVMKRLVKL